MKRIVLTGGGSAGHVSPHLSLIPRLIASGYEIHYIGRRSGIEYDLIHEIDGVTYHSVSSGKLRRYFSVTNFTDVFRVLWGTVQAHGLMRRLKPDVCFSKGGFVSIPVVIAAHFRRVPTVCHESDLTPGLANRISARFADCVATTFPECASCLGEKGVMTGTPLRPELFRGTRERGLQLADFRGDKPVLLVTGGSQGAQSINLCLRECLPALLTRMNILHLCGSGHADESLRGLAGYAQFEFLKDEMPDALAAADRAGPRGLQHPKRAAGAEKAHAADPLSAHRKPRRPDQERGKLRGAGLRARAAAGRPDPGNPDPRAVYAA